MQHHDKDRRVTRELQSVRTRLRRPPTAKAVNDLDRPRSAAPTTRPRWRRRLGLCGRKGCFASELDQVWLPETRAWRCNGCHETWTDVDHCGQSRFERNLRAQRRHKIAHWACAVAMTLILILALILIG